MSVSALRKLLPMVRALSPTVVVRLEEFQNAHMEEVASIFLDSSANGDGLSVDEFSMWPSVQDWIRSVLAVTILDHTTDEVIGVNIFRPSPLCRSSQPVNHAGYVAIKQGAFRGVGLGKHLLGNIGSFANLLGYSGLLGRTGIISTSVVPLKMNATEIRGVIPNSIYQQDLGWMDDIILFKSFDVPLPEIVPEIPTCQQHQSLLPSLRTFKLPVSLGGSFFVKRGKIKEQFNVEEASDSDLWLVEEMIRKEAEQGNGSFALDEFTEDGLFNRRLLHYSNNVVVKSHSGDIVAAAIIGPTSLCRSPNSHQIGGYIIVDQKRRNQGIGKEFLKFCITEAMTASYHALMSDVFVTNTRALQLLLSTGFQIYGTLPNCGYTKMAGYTDSLVVYKKLQKGLPNALSKL